MNDLTRQVFPDWAHPFELEIDDSHIYQKACIFFPMSMFKRGAVGFRDLSLYPEKRRMAVGYVTLLQMMGDLMRFLPRLGSDKAAKTTMITPEGRCETVPKARNIIQLVVRNNKSVGHDLPDHLLKAPDNQLGFLWMWVTEDSEMELLDLIDAFVKDNAANKPPERRAFLLQELKGYHPDRDSDDEDGDGEGEDEGEQEPPPAAPTPPRSPPTEEARDVDEFAFDDVDAVLEESTRKRPRPGEVPHLPPSEPAPPPKKRPKRSKRAEKSKKKSKKRPFAKKTDRAREFARQENKELVNKYIHCDKIDELFAAMSLLIVLASGRTEITEDRKYSNRDFLYSAIKSGTDPNVDLRSLLSLDVALARARAYAESHPAADGSPALSTQLSAEEYGRVSGKFHVPLPGLAWEYTQTQVSPKELMRSAFPWKTADPFTLFASAAVSHFGLTSEVGIPIIKRNAGLTTRSAVSALPPDERNADCVTAMLGLGRGAGVDAVYSEENWSPEKEFGEEPVQSALQPLGKTFRTVKTGLATYVASEIAKLRKIIEDSAAGRRQPPPPPRAPNFVDEPSTPPPAPRDVDDVVECRDKIAKLKQNYREAIEDLQRLAVQEMVPLLETPNAVQRSVASCALWASHHEDVVLDFTVKYRDIGVFGQFYASVLVGLKAHSIAVGQIQVFKLLIARDTAPLAYLLGPGRLPMHPILRGRYEVGKSAFMKESQVLSCPLAVNIHTGASSTGILPMREDKVPQGDDMHLFDELPNAITNPASRNQAADQKGAGLLASWMTSGLVDYPTVEQTESGRLRHTTLKVRASSSLGGACNKPKSNSAPEARMTGIPMPAKVPGPRNAADLMCNADTASGRDASTRALFEQTMQTINSWTMLTEKCMEVGLPVPDLTQFLHYLECALHFAKHKYPDLANCLRKAEVCHCVTAVNCIYTALNKVYAPGLQPLDADGVPLPAPAKFDLLRHRDLIIPHLIADEDVTFWTIGDLFYYASDPLAMMIVRSLVELVGHYPFVLYVKLTLKAIRAAAAAAAESGAAAMAAAAAAAAAKASDELLASACNDPSIDMFPDFEHPKSKPLELQAVVDKLVLLDPYDGEDVPTEASGGKKARGGRRATGRRPSQRGDGDAPRPAGGDGDGAGAAMSVADYDEAEGPTVKMKHSGKSGSKWQLYVDCQALLYGFSEPQYEYKLEKIRKDGVERIYYNPNYILLRGNKYSWATTFLSRTGGKMAYTEEQIAIEIGALYGKSRHAHMLPCVLADGTPDTKQFLISVEAYRPNLWGMAGVTRYLPDVPVVIRSKRGMYVLIEALLENPKRIAFSILNHLCNETTVTRKVLMPFCHPKYPEAAVVYEAKTVNRPLKGGNPGYMGKALDGLPSGARAQAEISGARYGDTLLQWDSAAELKTIKRFFHENGVFLNGVSLNPADFTYRHIYETRILARQRGAHGATMDNYPDEIIAADKLVDAEAAKEAIADDWLI